MKFTKEFLVESLEDGDETVEDVMTGKSRWSDNHRRVFRYDGKFYETFYRIGSTESQDESPYEYDKGEIECAEVAPVEKTIIVYERIKTASEAAA